MLTNDIFTAYIRCRNAEEQLLRASVAHDRGDAGSCEFRLEQAREYLADMAQALGLEITERKPAEAA